MKPLALGSQKDGLGTWVLSFQRFYRPDNRLWLHDHSGPAPKRVVIGRAVSIFGEIAQIPNPHLDPPFIYGFLQQALRQGGVENSRENGQDIKDHLWAAIP
jgi:hypothetical protein